jgi:hypothetical protein
VKLGRRRQTAEVRHTPASAPVAPLAPFDARHSRAAAEGYRDHRETAEAEGQSPDSQRHLKQVSIIVRQLNHCFSADKQEILLSMRMTIVYQKDESVVII